MVLSSMKGWRFTRLEFSFCRKECYAWTAKNFKIHRHFCWDWLYLVYCLYISNKMQCMIWIMYSTHTQMNLYKYRGGAHPIKRKYRTKHWNHKLKIIIVSTKWKSVVGKTQLCHELFLIFCLYLFETQLGFADYTFSFCRHKYNFYL